MKLSCNQSLKTLLLSSVVILNACSSGGSSGTTTTGETPEQLTITGSAVKGVIANADCVVTASDNTTVLYTSVNETTACTNSSGVYTIPLSPVPTAPVVVEIRGRTGTTMTCDAPNGCGNGVTFGQSLELASVRLKSLLNPENASTSTEVHVTPWSDVAANRAITLAGVGGSISATNVQQASQEVASVLNNILGLEGSADSFNADFLSVGALDLNNAASANVSTGREKSTTLLALASAALFDLVGTGQTINNVLTNLSTAFSSDGTFDPNATASNIEDAALGINLSSITSGIANVASNLGSVVDADTVTSINTFLGDDASLDSVATEATETATKKAEVADADQDRTRPIDAPTETLTADQKALNIAIQLDNMLRAFTAASNTTEDANTAIEDIDELLELGNADALDVLENITAVGIMAAEMLDDEASNAAGYLSSLGCTIGASTIVCSTAQIADTLAGNSPFAGNSSGTFTLNRETHTVTVADLTLTADGHAYAMTMVGDGADLDGASSAVYEITAATVTFASSGGTLNLGTGSTLTLGTSGSGSTLQKSVRVNLSDVTIAMTNVYTFTGDIIITYFTNLDGVTLTNVAVTEMNFDGNIVNNRANDSITNTLNDRVDFEMVVVIDESVLDGSNLPNLNAGSGETSNNFYRVTTGTISVGSPVTYEKRATSNFTSTTLASGTQESFQLDLDFTRTTPTPVASYNVALTLDSGTALSRLIGTITNGAETDTLTLNNGVAGVQVNLTSNNFTSQSSSPTFGGTVSIDGTQEAAIDSAGLFSIQLSDSVLAFQLAVN